MSSSQWLVTDLKTFSKKGYRGKCTDEVASNFTLGHKSITSSSFFLLLEPLNEREMAVEQYSLLLCHIWASSVVFWYYLEYKFYFPRGAYTIL
jgi:hypothetical protein